MIERCPVICWLWKQNNASVNRDTGKTQARFIRQESGRSIPSSPPTASNTAIDIVGTVQLARTNCANASIPQNEAIEPMPVSRPKAVHLKWEIKFKATVNSKLDEERRKVKNMQDDSGLHFLSVRKQRKDQLNLDGKKLHWAYSKYRPLTTVL